MKSFLPSLTWSIVSGLSLIGWISAVICLTRWGFLPDGSLAHGKGLLWIIVFVILYAVWFVGVSSL
jgi:hypothetical protein